MKTTDNKPYSLKKRIFLLFLATYALLSSIMIILDIWIYQILFSQTENNYSEFTENTAQQMSAELLNIQNFVLTTLISNNDLSTMKAASGKPELYITRARFMNYLQKYTPSYSLVDGMFFYVPESDSYVSAINSSSTSTPSAILQELRETVERDGLTDFITGTNNQWFIKTIGDDSYLIKYMSYSGKIGGAWIGLSSMLQKYSSPDYSADHLIFFASPETGICHSPGPMLDSYVYSAENKRISLPSPGGSGQQEYLQTTAEITNCSDQLVFLVPTRQIRRSLRSYYIVSLLLLLVLTAGSVVLYLLVRASISDPVNSLRRISAMLRESGANGENSFDLMLPPPKTTEIKELFEEISILNGQLSDMQNRVLMAELAKNRYELQSLKNQVSPHFLINCLSTLSSLNNTNQDPALMKSLINLLASHLRYTLSTKSMVSIQEEIKHLNNYFEMTKIRYPNSLTTDVHVLNLSHDASIFPGMILMLSENSIKHNLTIGEDLHIRIEAREDIIDGEHCVRIIHEDTGEGFPDELLPKLNHLQEASPDSISDGHNIGLYNIVKRLHLVYEGKNTSIRFSNAENGGARVEIVIPFIPYEES